MSKMEKKSRTSNRNTFGYERGCTWSIELKGDRNEAKEYFITVVQSLILSTVFRHNFNFKILNVKTHGQGHSL